MLSFKFIFNSSLRILIFELPNFSDDVYIPWKNALTERYFLQYTLNKIDAFDELIESEYSHPPITDNDEEISIIGKVHRQQQ